PARHFVAHEIGRQPLAHRDELHLGRDLALARVVELRHTPGARRTCRAATRLALRRAKADPRLAQLWQATRDIVVLRAARVVDAKRRRALLQSDLAHRNADPLGAVDVDLL